MLQRLLWVPLVLVSLSLYGLEEESLSEYKSRRERLAERLDDGPIVMFGVPERDLVEYRQEDNFYYLTGLEEPDSVLLVDGTGKEIKEFLFLRPRDPARERWAGPRLAPGPNARRRTGIASVESMAEFPIRFRRALDKTRTVYTLTAESNNLDRLTAMAPGAKFSDAGPAIAEMRQTKTPAEIALLEKAIGITLEAHEVAARAIAAGVMEYEVEALVEYTFRRNGAAGPAFPSIVASGPYSTILHYSRSARKMESADLVVLDIGAEYRGYAADVTRTYPVGGRFSAEQRAIYQIVLEAQQAALAQVRPGVGIGRSSPIYRAAFEHIRSKGYGKYFIHGISHHIGLDVHDVGDVDRALEPGMVITVEPGIYIPEKNLGIRIEDDVLVTQDGYTMLSAFPRKAEEIEALMRGPNR